MSWWIADASGHGPEAARFWDRHGEAVDASWRAFVRDGDLAALTDAVDARLSASGDPTDHLCLSAGRWTAGELQFANCGFGTHTLVRAGGAPWWTEPEQLFGLKLGWVGPERRRVLPRGLIVHEIPATDRVVLMTDALLGDDHADPVGTLEGLRELHETACRLPFEEVLLALLASYPGPEDDLTVVVLERG